MSLESSESAAHERSRRRAQLRTTAVYALVGVLWIASSDHVLEWVAQDVRDLSRLQTYKGWFFICATTALLYVLVDRATRSLQSAQAKLAAQHRALQVLVSNLPGCVYRRAGGLDGPIESVNETLRVPSSEAQLGLCHAVVHPEDRERVEREMTRALAAGRPYQVTYRVLAPNHEVRWVWNHGQRVDGAGASPAAIEGYMVDVTETKLLEERLQKAQHLESLGRVTGSIAHDFNNVLTVIMSSSDFLAGAVRSDEAKDDVASIQRAARSARELVAQLLAFARRQKREPADLEVDAVVNDLALMLKRAAKNRCAVLLELGAPGSITRGDRSQLEQILMNLVTNAGDAVGAGGTIRVETSARELAEAEAAEAGVGPGAYVAIRVADDGCGIAPEHLPQIFEPFYTTKGEQGTGLGLATVYGIVRQSGGGIVVRSEVGKGTTFEVLLPRSAMAVPRTDSDPSAGPSVQRDSKQPTAS